MALHKGGEMEQNFQIHLDQIFDAGALYLDGNVVTIFENGSVNLPDGGRCKGRLFDTFKGIGIMISSFTFSICL